MAWGAACRLTVLVGFFSACGGSTPSPAPAPVSAASRDDVLYLGGQAGYWGLRIGADGALSLISGSRVINGFPYFSPDGRRVASIENTAVVFRSVTDSGLMGAVEGSMSTAEAFRNLPGSIGYVVAWNPSGNILVFAGGETSSEVAEVVALVPQGGGVVRTPGSPQAIGHTMRSLLFVNDHTVVARSWGTRALSGLGPGQLDVFDVAYAALRRTQTLDRRPPGTEDGTPLLMADGKTLVAGDISVRVSGDTLEPLAILPENAAAGRLQTVMPLFDRFVAAHSANNSGEFTLDVHRVESDGSFGLISSVRTFEFGFWTGLPMKQGRVLVLQPSSPDGFFGTVVVDSLGRTGPIRRSAWRRTAGVEPIGCVSDRTQTYLYCAGLNSLAFYSARVDEDGTLTPLNSLPTGVTLTGTRAFIVKRP